LDAGFEKVGGLEEECARYARAQSGCEVECWDRVISICMYATGIDEQKSKAYPPTTCVSGRHLSCPLSLMIYTVLYGKNDEGLFKASSTCL
jgi:hypothetical protein